MTVVESIQIAIFVEPAGSPKSALVVGQELMPGRTPTQFNQLNPARSQAMFSEDEHQFVVASAPDRYDVIVSKGIAGPELHSVDVEAVKDRLIAATSAVAKANKAVRLAVVVSASRVIASAEEGLADFNRIVGHDCTPRGATEVDYKVNVPRQSTVSPDLTLNRLHRWWTAAAIWMAVTPSGTSTVNSWLFSEQLDMNTNSDQRIDTERSGDIISELWDEAFNQMGAGPEKLEV